MKEYRGILIQTVEDEYGEHISDGIFNFTITANNENKATCKMLDYFYEVYWYCGEEDVDIDLFKDMHEYEKVNALNMMNCTFDYIVYYNKENTEGVEIVI